jgi:hypothetical protein
MKRFYKIVSRKDAEKVFYECKIPDDIPDALEARYALENASINRAYLRGANLSGVNLSGVNLSGANLRNVNLSDAFLYCTNLRGADLYCANLRGADLRGAELSGAYLYGADLSDADLSGAELSGANLMRACMSGVLLNKLRVIGKHPLLMIDPMGSRQSTLYIWLTDKGLRIKTECFFGTREEFAAAIEQTHGASAHGDEYRAALTLIDAHARLWGEQEDV